MISKSLIDVGEVLEIGAAEGWRGESGPAEMIPVGLRAGGLDAVECLRWLLRPSRGDTRGERGGVRSDLISEMFWTDFVAAATRPNRFDSSRYMGGGTSSEDATIGAASARGEEMEEGVDERV